MINYYTITFVFQRHWLKKRKSQKWQFSSDLEMKKDG